MAKNRTGIERITGSSGLSKTFISERSIKITPRLLCRFYLNHTFSHKVSVFRSVAKHTDFMSGKVNHINKRCVSHAPLNIKIWMRKRRAIGVCRMKINGIVTCIGFDDSKTLNLIISMLSEPLRQL